jgi:hypothetical protein
LTNAREALVLFCSHEFTLTQKVKDENDFAHESATRHGTAFCLRYFVIGIDHSPPHAWGKMPWARH